MPDVHILTAKATIGDPVKNANGEDLGIIRNVLVNEEQSSVDYAVVYSETNNKDIAVPFDALELNGEEGYFLFDMEKDIFCNPVETVSYQGRSYSSHKK